MFYAVVIMVIYFSGTYSIFYVMTQKSDAGFMLLWFLYFDFFMYESTVLIIDFTQF